MITAHQIVMPFAIPPSHPFAGLIGAEYVILGVRYRVMAVDRVVKSRVIVRAIELKQEFSMPGKLIGPMVNRKEPNE